VGRGGGPSGPGRRSKRAGAQQLRQLGLGDLPTLAEDRWRKIAFRPDYQRLLESLLQWKVTVTVARKAAGGDGMVRSYGVSQGREEPDPTSEWLSEAPAGSVQGGHCRTVVYRSRVPSRKAWSQWRQLPPAQRSRLPISGAAAAAPRHARSCARTRSSRSCLQPSNMRPIRTWRGTLV